MKQARQKRTAKVLAAAFSVVLTLAMIFAILPAQAEGTTVDLSALTANYEAKDGETLTGTLGGNYKISIADGATVTLKDVTINGVKSSKCKWAGITCNGNATIILSGENTVTGFYEDYPGILVPANKTLTIQGDGALTASAGQDGFGAGIGGMGNSDCGSIVIEGGTITAIGSVMGAGIGNAGGKCGDITITGGTVIATGGSEGAGIGGGATGTCGNITIANTVTKVTATKGENAANSIGIGNGGSCGTVTIGGEEIANGVTESPYTYEGTAQAEEPAYYLWGSMMDWNREDRSTPFSATETEGVYSATNVSFSAGAEFKVLAVLGESNVTYPEGMDNAYTVEADGTYNVYFRPAGDGAKADGWHEGYIKVEAAAVEAAGEYTITVEQPGDEGGTISADVAKADSGATVTLTASPNEGMMLYEWTVTDAGNNPVIVADDGTFTMPQSNVKVTATFMEIDHIVESLTGAAINGTAIGDGDLGELFGVGSVSISTVYATAPTVTFVKETDVYFVGVSDPKVTTTNIDFVAAEGEDSWSAQLTLGDATYKISVAKAKTTDLSTLTADYVAQDGEILTGTLGGNYKLSIAGGATVTLDTVTINCNKDAGLTCNNATLILKGKNTVRSSAEECPGILVADYSRLTISGDGSLDVYGAENAAGIGGRFNKDCGTIVIESGTITAHGGTSGAGIGSGNYAACSGIEISGGIVKAYGGEEGGAGIGTGAYASYCAYIKISGGRIYAQGTDYEYDWGSAGIGTGVSSSISSGDSTCEKIMITGGNIEAVGGPGAAAIGAGSGYKFYDVEMEEEYVSTSECNEIQITDGVGKLKATKGSGSPQTIGGGKISRCVWGVKVLGGGAVSESPYNYLSPGPAGVIVLIDEIPNPVNGSDACKKAIEAARAAYDKLATDEQKALVTNYDVLTAAEAIIAVAVANEKIDAIPAVENITLKSKTVIEAARAAYNALTDAQKAEISAEKVNKLTAAEAKYAEVKEADDTAKANNAMDKINAIGTVEYTAESKTKIDAAKTAYDALTDDQKAKVTNYNTLTEAESSYQVAETEALIAAIGTVEYTAESKAKIDAAKTAYDALTDDQKSKVTNYNTLTEAEGSYQVAETEALIAAIGTVEYTAESKAKIDAAKEAYNALTDDQKALVENYNALTTAESTYTTLKADHDAADAVKAKIDAIGTVELTVNSKALIDLASEAYNDLTDDQKALVTNYNVLTTSEATYKALGVKDAIANIGTVEYTAESKAKIDAAKEAYNALTTEEKALVENYNALTTAESTYTTLKGNHEAAEAVKAQIEAIGTVEYNADSKAKIDAAKEAYNALTDDQKALVENYNALTNAESTYEQKAAAAVDPGKNNQNENKDDNKDTTKKGLPGGVIALIVMLCLLVVACGAFAIVWFVVWKKTWAAFVALLTASFKKNDVNAEEEKAEEPEDPQDKQD